jgi:hypothetical protein
MDSNEEERLMSEGRVAGWTLVQHETDLGQVVWSWRSAERADLGPKFLTRREAADFMRQLDLLSAAQLDQCVERTPDASSGPPTEPALCRRFDDPSPPVA